MNEANPAALSVRGLSKGYAGQPILRDVNLSVVAGEVAAIVGPSGAGKSTLLCCINLLELPDAGTIERDGVPIGAWRDEAGRRHRQPRRELNAARAQMPMVFQRFNLFENLSVIDNVMLAQRRVLHRDKADARQRALAALSRVHLADKRDSYPGQLSGGQAQRVAIARAIATDPTLLLLDEPTSSLDPLLVNEVVEVISDLAADGMTMLLVTHEMTVVRNVASTVHLLSDGAIVKSSSPEHFFADSEQALVTAFTGAAGLQHVLR